MLPPEQFWLLSLPDCHNIKIMKSWNLVGSLSGHNQTPQKNWCSENKTFLEHFDTFLAPCTTFLEHFDTFLAPQDMFKIVLAFCSCLESLKGSWQSEGVLTVKRPYLDCILWRPWISRSGIQNAGGPCREISFRKYMLERRKKIKFVLTFTRRFVPLHVPISSYCWGLWASIKVFFALLGEKGLFCSIGPFKAIFIVQ